MDPSGSELQELRRLVGELTARVFRIEQTLDLPLPEFRFKHRHGHRFRSRSRRNRRRARRKSHRGLRRKSLAKSGQHRLGVRIGSRTG